MSSGAASTSVVGFESGELVCVNDSRPADRLSSLCYRRRLTFLDLGFLSVSWVLIAESQSNKILFPHLGPSL